MNMAQYKERHRGIEISIGSKAMRELIRSIQEKKGRNPCFQTGKQSCDQYDCSWRHDCMP